MCERNDWISDLRANAAQEDGPYRGLERGSSPVRLDYIFGAISPAEGGRRAIPPGPTTFREDTGPNRSPAHGEERGQQPWVLGKPLPSLSRRQYATIVLEP